MPKLIYFLSLLPIPILGTIAVLMYRRKQHRVYPFFWIYICFQFFRVAVYAIVNPISYRAYFYAYWIASFCSVFLSLLLLRSIFVLVLANYSSLAKTRRLGYEIALGCFWSAALLIAFQQTSVHRFSDTIVRAEQAVSFTAVGMLLFVVVCSMFLGIKWSAAVCGIASGIGLLGTMDLLVYTLWRGTDYRSHAVLVGWIETLAFDASVGIFAFYFLPAHAESKPPGPMRPEVLQWAESMKGALSK